MPVEASPACEFDREAVLEALLVRVGCEVDAVLSVHGISVVFALLKKFFVPWLNLSNAEGSVRRFWLERDCRVVVRLGVRRDIELVRGASV